MMEDLNFDLRRPDVGSYERLRDVLRALNRESTELDEGLGRAAAQGGQLTRALGNLRQVAGVGQAVAQIANLGTATQRTGQQLAGAARALAGFVQDQTLDRVRRLTAAYDRQAERVEDVRRAVLAGGEATAAASATQLAAEEDRLRKLDALRQQAVERQQALAAIQLAVNTAVAVSRAAAEGGGLGAPLTIGVVLAALAAGLAQARQLARTAAQAERGGVVGQGRLVNARGGGLLEGPRHRDGGILIEAEGGERIFDRHTSRRWAPLFEAIARGEAPPVPANPTPPAPDPALAELTRQLTQLTQALRTQPAPQIWLDDRGLSAALRTADHRHRRLRRKTHP